MTDIFFIVIGRTNNKSVIARCIFLFTLVILSSLLGVICVSSASAQVLNVFPDFPPNGGPSPDSDFKMVMGAPPLSFTLKFMGSDVLSPLFCNVSLYNSSNGVLMVNVSQVIMDYNNPPPFFLPPGFSLLAPPEQLANYTWNASCTNGTVSNASKSSKSLIVTISTPIFSGGIVGSDGMNFSFSQGPPTPLGNDDFDASTGQSNSTNLSTMAIREAPNSAVVELMVSVTGDVIGTSLAMHQPPDFPPVLSNFNGMSRTPFCTGNATLTPRSDLQYFVYVDFDGNQSTGCSISNPEINSSGYDFAIFLNASQYGSNPEFRNCTVTDGNFSDSTNYTLLPGIVDINYMESCTIMGVAGFRITTASITGLSGKQKGSVQAGFGFEVEIYNASGWQDSFNRRLKYTPGTMDFIPFNPEMCRNNTNKAELNLTYASGHGECSIFAGCGAANCQQMPGQGFLNQSNFENCFANGPISPSTCQSNPNCAFLPVCRLFVNDTTTPLVRSTNTVGFNDRAFIDWDTNEPSNGSVSFYNSDSSCASVNTTVKESFPPPPPGVSFPGDFKYKPFHHVELSSTSNSIGSPLTVGSTYYYKTTSCDSSGNCAISNCLSFSTDQYNSFSAPKFLEFAQPPNVNFQFDDGSGQFNDFNGGSQDGGRDFKLRFGSPNGTWSIVLVGVDITSNLSINFSNAFAIDETVGASRVGINSTTWLEIAQKLGADTIELTIPGNGNSLFKCSEDGTDCSDVSSLATMVSQTAGSTTWRIPVSLGFSSYSVNSSNGFTLTADQGVYGAYPQYLTGYVNLTNSNASISATYNLSVNITHTLVSENLNFSIAVNATLGNWSPPNYRSNQSQDFRFDGVQLSSDSITQFRFNVSSSKAVGGMFNFTIRLSMAGQDGVNVTIEQLSPFQVGAINITTQSGIISSSSNVNFSFIYDSIDDALQLCTLVVDGVVNASNSSSANATPTILMATGISEGLHNATIVCVDDQAPADNVTTNVISFTVDSSSPQLTINSPVSGELVSAQYLLVNASVVESAVANFSIYVDGLVVFSNNLNGTNLSNASSVDGGKHTLFARVNDTSGSVAVSSNRTFYLNKLEDMARRASELNRSFGGNKLLNITLQLATDAVPLSSASLVNQNLVLNVSINMTAVPTGVEVGVLIPFNGSVAVWNSTLSVRLNSSASDPMALALGNMTLTTVSRLVQFTSFDQFINKSDYNTVSVQFNETISGKNIFYVENDSVSPSSVHRLSNCSGTNATPASVTTAAQACYTATSTSFTIYVPHLSAVAVATDNVAPIVVPVVPVANQMLNDSLLRFSFIVNETNPLANGSALCNYNITNKSNQIILTSASVTLSSFTYLSNFSLNYLVNVTGLDGINPGTNYSLNITCADTSGNSGSSSINFTVNDTTWPEIQPPTVALTSTSIAVTWTTSELANSTVNISGFTSAKNTNFALAHNSLTVSGLSASTSYAYSIVTCDKSGNCAIYSSTSTTSSSSSSSSSSGGGGGGSGSSSNTSTTAPTSISQSWSNLVAGISTSVLPGSSAIAATEIIFKLKAAATNAKLAVSSVGSTVPPGLTKPAAFVIFQYLDVTPTNIVNANIAEASIKFTVDKAWLTANNVQEANVYLLHYDNNTWKTLTTQVLSSGTTQVTYLATTPGFSYFAVGGKQSAVAANNTPPPPAAIVPAPNGTAAPPLPADQQGSDGAQPDDSKVSKPAPMQMWLWVGAIVVVLGLVGGYFLFSRKKSKKPRL